MVPIAEKPTGFNNTYSGIVLEDNGIHILINFEYIFGHIITIEYMYPRSIRTSMNIRVDIQYIPIADPLWLISCNSTVLSRTPYSNDTCTTESDSFVKYVACRKLNTATEVK